MKKLYLCSLFITVLFLTNIYIVDVFALEKGNPTGGYYYDEIILPENKSIKITQDYIALFVNGTLTPDYQK